MADAILVDGEWQAHLPADDRGLAYGDGVFRTLRVEAGEPVAWGVHLQRLAHDCGRLFLPVPDKKQLADDVDRLFSGGRSGVVKIMITRGSGGRGYTPPLEGSRRIVSAHPLPEDSDRQSPLILTCSPVILGQQARLAGVKHLNRLEQVLAREECRRAGTEDAVMCDHEDRVICTTMRNLLFVSAEGEWLTPALTRAGIIGATRQRLTSALSAAGVAVHETDIARSQLQTFRGAVACNSVGGVRSVSQIDGCIFAESESACEYARKLLI